MENSSVAEVNGFGLSYLPRRARCSVDTKSTYLEGMRSDIDWLAIFSGLSVQLLAQKRGTNMPGPNVA